MSVSLMAVSGYGTNTQQNENKPVKGRINRYQYFDKSSIKEKDTDIKLVVMDT